MSHGLWAFLYVVLALAAVLVGDFAVLAIALYLNMLLVHHVTNIYIEIKRGNKK